MTHVSEVWRDYQRKRFMRPDAARYRKPDFARHLPSPAPFYDDLYARKYRDDQLRHPAGSSEGGGRFAPEGGGNSGGGGTPKVRLAFAGPAAAAARATVQLGLTLYTAMSAQNGPGKRAIVKFRARKFETGLSELDFKATENLDLDEVGQACPRFGEVQERTDKAASSVKASDRTLSPQQYGTAIHTNLKGQIERLNDPNFVAEESFLKSEEGRARYGAKGSIRVDVLENVGNGTVCVYDVKTGNAKLDGPRMREIAENVYKHYPNTREIVVIEVRPAR